MTPNEKNERIRKIIEADHRRWLRLSVFQNRELETLYRERGNNLRVSLEDEAGFGGELRLSQMRSLENIVESHIRNMSRYREFLFTGAFLAAASSGSARIARISKIVPEVERVLPRLSSIDRMAVDWGIRFVPEDGLSLSARLWREDQIAQGRILQTLHASLLDREALHKTTAELLHGNYTVETARAITKAIEKKGAPEVAKSVGNLFKPTAPKNIVFNAKRILITETNRINRHSFRLTCGQTPGVIGMRFNLSSSHPRHDICDEFAMDNSHGLGPGGYPLDNLPPNSAHPLCICFESPIFAWEAG